MSINDKTLIIDATYRCNLSCRYCKWSIDNEVTRKEIDYKEISLSKNILDALNIDRVVFSGGEPLLRDDIYELIYHYHKLDMESILITNGLKLNETVLSKLIENGLTGLTFSIDSLDYKVLSKLRRLSEKEFKRIIKMISVAKEKYNELEIGINVTITPLNLNSENIHELYEFVLNNDLDFIKFQPVFDDGHDNGKEDEIFFDEHNIEIFRKIAEITKEYMKYGVTTNPPEFWRDVHSLITGNNLASESCSALGHQVMLIDGNIQTCYWRPDFSFSPDSISKIKLESKIEEYRKSLNRCTVNYWCFCNQPLDQIWRDEK